LETFTTKAQRAQRKHFDDAPLECRASIGISIYF
jgi:hypothetical protein